MTRAKTVIHVNMHVIRSNAKTGACEPTLSVKHRGRTVRAHEVTIDGPSKIVYRPNKPLSCGARCWIETYANVEVS